MVYYFLSVLSGLLISLMISINGNLTGTYGVYLSTVLIHLVGLVCITGVCIYKKEKIFHLSGVSFLFFTGGVIGVATTVFNNVCFGKIPVTAIVALALLGESITALTIDQFGLFHMPKRSFHKAKLIGILFVVIGIATMLNGSPFVFLPILLSLLTGATVVTSRTINAGLSAKTSTFTATWYNYGIGLFVSVILLILCDRPILQNLSTLTLPRFWWFSGGFIGVLVIVISNLIVHRIPAFYMTLCLFIGQIFMGIVMDTIITQSFSSRHFIGGILVAVGLSGNLWFETRIRPKK